MQTRNILLAAASAFVATGAFADPATPRQQFERLCDKSVTLPARKRRDACPCLIRGVRTQLVLLALLLVVAGPSTARASVKCLSSGNPVNTSIPKVLVVFPKFSTPARGKCNELAGYEASTAFAFPASATACLNSAGNTIYIGVTVRFFAHEHGGVAADTPEELLSFELPYPASTGGFLGAGSNGLAFSTSSDASLATCHPFPMP